MYEIVRRLGECGRRGGGGGGKRKCRDNYFPRQSFRFSHAIKSNKEGLKRQESILSSQIRLTMSEPIASGAAFRMNPLVEGPTPMQGQPWS